MPTGPAVLVLGASGMLGATVLHRLRATRAGWRVDGAGRGRDHRLTIEAEAGRPGVADLFRAARYDYVVNCIGVLKPAIDIAAPDSVERAVRVNALFPHEAADVAAEHGAKLIHVSSDAVFSGRSPEAYDEAAPPDPIDHYGATKLLGESPAAHVLNVRCSIVGRDRRQRGLLEWYLSARSAAVSGFTDYVWTPVTTVQFADWCGGVIAGGFDRLRQGGHVVHLAPNPAMSKAAFLESVRARTGGAAIEPAASPDGPCRRVLTSRASVPAAAWPEVIGEALAEFSSRGA